MTIQTSSVKNLSALSADLVVIGQFSGDKELNPTLKSLDQKLHQEISSAFSKKRFLGKAGETLSLHTYQTLPFPHLLVVGLGKRTEYSLESLRVFAAAAVPVAHKHRVQNLAIVLPAVLPNKTTPTQAGQAVAESLTLAAYRFLEYKKIPQDEQLEKISTLTIVINLADLARVKNSAQRGTTIAEAVNYARDLANHPGNVMTPSTLADEAVKLARQYKLRCRVLEKPEMEKQGFGALLGVNMGSDLPPKFIILEYNFRKSGAPTVLVGKGITFDSGGISIKPSRAMEEMKFDMAGAATVLGTFKAVAELKLPTKLVGLIPATENMPSGSALRPGDVVKALNGKTIEVTNTDAEGRMILADALSYAGHFKPKLVIDFATLTGSVVSALGTLYSGAFATDERLAEKLKTASRLSGEKIWLLPLANEYKEKLKANIADIDNVGTAQGAGTITAALFLQEFVSYPWIHLDIAGTAWATEPRAYFQKGATGVGVRLMMEFLK